MTAISTLDRDQRIGTIYSRRVEKGHDAQSIVKLLAAIHRLTRPSIYKALRRVGALPPYGTARDRKGPASPAIVSAFVLPPVVNRDPCPRCGVRADYGCNHGRVHSLTGAVFG